MKKHKYLKETTHRRTYNIVSKESFAVCSRCRWHPTFWLECMDNPYIYFMYEDDGTDKPGRLKYKNYPNWKMVSKNKKQWMAKRYVEMRRTLADCSYIIRYNW